MNKPSLLSTKENTVIYKEVKLTYGKDFIITEHYENDVLKDQYWTTKIGLEKSHPTMYRPDLAKFYYYEDISFLDSEKCINLESSLGNLPKATLIKDWSDFKGLNHVLLSWVGMDGNVYRIDETEPIPLWREQDYISGITNENYDLNEAKKIIKKLSWVRNVKIRAIPYYNCSRNCDEFLGFDYKLPSSKDLAKKLKEIPMFKDGYFG